MRWVWVVIPLVIFTISALSGSAFAEQSISEQINDNPKFQRFDNKILGLIDEKVFEKINVRFFSPKFGIYQNEQTQQQAIKQISKLIDEWYGGQILQVSENQVGKYVEASIPIEHLLSMAKHDFVFIVMYVGSESNDDENVPLSEKIRTNSKFERFGDSLLEAIKNDEIDEYSVTILPAYYSFDVKDKHHEKELIEKLENALRNDHGIEEMAVSRTSISMLVPIEELPKIAEYDFAQRIIGKGFGFKYFNEDKSEGITFLDDDGQLFRLPYSIPEGKILYLGHLYFRLISNEGGFIDITFPRELIDPADIQGEFYKPFQYEEKEDYKILEDNCQYKKIRFYLSPDNDGKASIGLISHVTTSDVSKVRDAWLAAKAKDKFEIKMDGKKFEITTIQGGTVCNLDFSSEEKKISIFGQGFSNRNYADLLLQYYTIQIHIPHDLLGGEFEVFTNGDSVDFELKSTTTHNIISIPKETVSNHLETNQITVEIIGEKLFPNPLVLPHDTTVSVNGSDPDTDLAYIIQGGTIISADAYYSGYAASRVLLLLSVQAEHDGQITITLPDSFIKKQANGFRVTENGKSIKISWQMVGTDNPTITIPFSKDVKYLGILGDSTLYKGFYKKIDQCWMNGSCDLQESGDIITYTKIDRPAPDKNWVPILSKPQILDSIGNLIDTVNTGQMVHLSADLANKSSKPLVFVYQIEVYDSDGNLADDPQWISGEINRGQILEPSLSWTPDSSGDYTINFLAGTHIDFLYLQETISVTVLGDNTNAKKTSSVASFVDPAKDPQHYIHRYNNEFAYKEWFDKNYPDITIRKAVGLSHTIPDSMKDNIKKWSKNQMDKSEFAEIIIHVTETNMSKPDIEKIPEWIRNTAEWWANDLISEDEFVSGLEFLVKSGIVRVS